MKILSACCIVSVCIATYLFFSTRPLIPDIAWLIVASRRWVAGARLYVDIIEVNPPLIFYETVALTGGKLTTASYIGGVTAVMGLSALWVLRLRGSLAALSALSAMLIGGMTDFGQRDHLCVIFVMPFLLGTTAGKNERALMGLWAFFGVGLKPYLLLIPIAAVASRAVMARSTKPLWLFDTLALAAACGAYLIFVVTIHPAYLTYIVPLGQFVYWIYGNPFQYIFLGITIAASATAAIPILERDPELAPLGWATLAALASFYIQGRNWSYHLVPAISLAILLALLLTRTISAAYLLVASLIGLQVYRGPHPGEQTPHVIPPGVRSVAFLVAHVYPAYPESLDCGVTNATRYPALWVIPGAWDIAHDPQRSLADRRRASTILAHERQTIIADLNRWQPVLLFVDARRQKPYFQYPFDYVQFLNGLPGYVRAGHAVYYDVWARVGRAVPKVVVPSRAHC